MRFSKKQFDRNITLQRLGIDLIVRKYTPAMKQDRKLQPSVFRIAICIRHNFLNTPV